MLPVVVGGSSLVIILVAVSVLSELTWKRAVIGLLVLIVAGFLILSPYLGELERFGDWTGSNGHVFIVLPALVAVVLIARYGARRIANARADRLAWPSRIGQPTYEDACISYLKRHGWECSGKSGICGMGWVRCKKGDEQGVLVLIRIDQMLTPVLDTARQSNIRGGLPLKFVCFRRPTDAARRTVETHGITIIHYSELSGLSFRPQIKRAA